MDVLGFVGWKGIGACKKFTSFPFVQKKIGSYVFTSCMAYDEVSSTEYDPNKGDYTRYRGLELIAEQISRNSIQGAVAELGVFRGDFSSEINRIFPDAKLYLFDTFEGFDDSDVEYERKKDYTSKEFIDGCNSFKDTSVDVVLKKMPYPDQCIVRKGYFPETAQGLEDTFILVSIDCDLYVPILAGLEYFYPRLVPGGYIMLHDYNHKEFGVKDAVADFEKKNGRVCKVPYPDQGGTLVIYKN